MNLLERIDHWAKTTPTAIAHVSGGKELTFRQLKSQSDALAESLLEICGSNQTPVAVLGNREPEMLVAFIGAVKSGRPYIPIDRTLPPERINQILELAKPAIVLTPEKTARLSCLKTLAPFRPLRPDDPFYIIFTSGSTGTPKGIIISRQSLEYFVGEMLRQQKFTEGGEIFLNQAPFSFDLSVMDLYCSLAIGGRLFSIGRDLLCNPKLFYQALADSGLTTWVSTPSFAEMCLLERKFNRLMLPMLRRFLFCGEILLAETARALLDRFPEAEVWNLYGPTETTVATTSVRIDHEILAKYPNLPVGRALPGSEIFIADKNCDAVSNGRPDEIIIKGPNVSSGYLARPDLNTAHFFQTNGQRGYRTGDLGRFQDGLLFFEGRIDNQIKLNGHRIELEDLEANLRALPMVRDAVVLPVLKNGKAHRLRCFVVPSKDSKENEQDLPSTIREGLRERVPAYMMPRTFEVMDAFPLTANGKIDRRKLAQSP